MLARAWDSDFAYSFRTSPVAVASALVALVLVAAAVLAPWIAPHDPMDVASLSLLDSFKPPIGLPDAEWSNLLGTDNQGRDVLSAIMYGMRISLLVGIFSVIFAIAVGIALGLLSRVCWRDRRHRADAHRRCATDVSVDPDGAAGRWGDQCRAAPYDCGTRCRSMSSFSQSGSVCGRISRAPRVGRRW